jgi:IS1 family transposase
MLTFSQFERELASERTKDKLLERDINITLTKSAKAYIAEAGFDPVYGARPLKRALYEVVEDRLAELILEDKVMEGSSVAFDVVEGEIEVVEFDELFTFVGKKSQPAYIASIIDRATRCFLACEVITGRDSESWQRVIDRAPVAREYHSDDLNVYKRLVYYPGRHRAHRHKRETYSVEGVNAELRHYLARLGRRSRCFSRSVEGLREGLKLFVFAWNRRQLAKRAFPQYPAHVKDFVYP